MTIKKMLRAEINIHADLKRLRSNCIDNVEVEFNKYLLNDICDAGEVDQLFDNESWYLYYLEAALELNRIINALLNDKRDKKLLLEAIAIKRIVDAKLIEYSDGNYTLIYQDLGFGQKTEVQLKLNNQKVKNVARFVGRLHNQLRIRKWVEDNDESFKNLFINAEDKRKVNWMGNQNRLVGVIKYLNQAKYLDIQPQNSTLLIRELFTVKGKKIPLGSLKVTYSTMFTVGHIGTEEFEFIDSCNI